MHFAYLLACADGTLYAGSTNDLERRLKLHNESNRGAKYTRSRRPVVLAYAERCASRSEALRREAQIKRLTRAQKLRLIGETAAKSAAVAKRRPGRKRAS